MAYMIVSLGRRRQGNIARLAQIFDHLTSDVEQVSHGGILIVTKLTDGAEAESGDCDGHSLTLSRVETLRDDFKDAAEQRDVTIVLASSGIHV